MSAQPIEGRLTGWHPDPRRQRAGDFTMGDVLDLPADAPRVELADGVMIAVPSPTADHQDTCSLLWSWLRRHAPERYRAVQAVGVAVAVDQTYEPDVVVLRPGVSGRRHFYQSDEVLLAVEVVSKGTRSRDRFAKPAEYAAAGIAHYWRVEQEPVHLFAYRLGQDGTYRLVAENQERVTLDEPFPISLAIAEITP